jgi:superfamily I DNA/RNA helicase
MPEPINTQQFQKYYDALNSEQKAAVDAIEGPVMTIAGAGTGKTQILAVRIAKILLETQIDPFNILCLTFTDAGVSAMRKRLIEIIGPTAYHIKVSTFHSFCNEVIKDNTEKFLFKRDFDQIDDLEKVDLLQEIIDELGVRSVIRPHGDPYHYQFDLEGRIKDLKKENFPPEKFAKKVSEVAEFLKQFSPLISDFINISGAPKEEQIAAMHPDLLLTKMPRTDESSLHNSYLNFYKKIWQDYESALTGEKRVDSTKRTAFKNALKLFFLGAEKDLPKQQELAKAYALYQKKLTEKARYDYEDMILFVSQKFAQDEELRTPTPPRIRPSTYSEIILKHPIFLWSAMMTNPFSVFREHLSKTLLIFINATASHPNLS